MKAKHSKSMSSEATNKTINGVRGVARFAAKPIARCPGPILSSRLVNAPTIPLFRHAWMTASRAVY